MPDRLTVELLSRLERVSLNAAAYCEIVSADAGSGPRETDQ